VAFGTVIKDVVDTGQGVGVGDGVVVELSIIVYPTR
jgi:hypothetical protein